MISLKNRTALITGSSRGIGQQIAIGLAQHDCDIILHGRSPENCTATAKLLERYDVRVTTVSGELDSEEGIASIISGVKKSGRQIDILYNNAAIMSPWLPIGETPLSVWLKTMQVNLFAVIMLCNAFIPGMKERKFGRVINLTSGIKETPHLAPYGVSKAAIDKYSQELAYECRGTNVLVNYLDPGWLKTDLGGPNAMFTVDTVLPGALVPALLEDNGPSGKFYCAQDFKYLD